MKINKSGFTNSHPRLNEAIHKHSVQLHFILFMKLIVKMRENFPSSVNKRYLFQNYMNSPTNVSKELKNLPEVMEQNKTVTHHNGVEVRLTLFRPSGTQNQSLPVVLFFHGGGWVFGSKHTHIKPVRNICTKNHVAVVFVDYSLAPEHCT
ncbi:Alpha/Beta hydrolase protein [Circinella umbellata]|nr:Alpha/Beta hydrolase protein [Circinella umbellata]